MKYKKCYDSNSMENQESGIIKVIWALELVLNLNEHFLNSTNDHSNILEIQEV